MVARVSVQKLFCCFYVREFASNVDLRIVTSVINNRTSFADREQVLLAK